MSTNGEGTKARRSTATPREGSVESTNRIRTTLKKLFDDEQSNRSGGLLHGTQEHHRNRVRNSGYPQNMAEEHRRFIDIDLEILKKETSWDNRFYIDTIPPYDATNDRHCTYTRSSAFVQLKHESAAANPSFTEKLFVPRHKQRSANNDVKPTATVPPLARSLGASYINSIQNGSNNDTQQQGGRMRSATSMGLNRSSYRSEQISSSLDSHRRNDPLRKIMAASREIPARTRSAEPRLSRTTTTAAATAAASTSTTTTTTGAGSSVNSSTDAEDFAPTAQQFKGLKQDVVAAYLSAVSKRAPSRGKSRSSSSSSSSPSPSNQSMETLFAKSKKRIQKLWAELHIPVEERERFSSIYFKEVNVQNMTVITDEIHRLLEHRTKTLQVLKNIDIRESHLTNLRNLEALSQTGNMSTSLLKGELRTLVDFMRLSTLETVESIVSWRESLGQPTKSFIYNGTSYLLKIAGDLKFFADSSLSQLIPDVVAHNNPLLIAHHPPLSGEEFSPTNYVASSNSSSGDDCNDEPRTLYSSRRSSAPKFRDLTQSKEYPFAGAFGKRTRLPPLAEADASAAKRKQQKKQALSPPQRDPFRERLLAAEKVVFEEEQRLNTLPSTSLEGDSYHPSSPNGSPQSDRLVPTLLDPRISLSPSRRQSPTRKSSSSPKKKRHPTNRTNNLSYAEYEEIINKEIKEINKAGKRWFASHVKHAFDEASSVSTNEESPLNNTSSPAEAVFPALKPTDLNGLQSQDEEEKASYGGNEADDEGIQAIQPIDFQSSPRLTLDSSLFSDDGTVIMNTSLDVSSSPRTPRSTLAHVRLLQDKKKTEEDSAIRIQSYARGYIARKRAKQLREHARQRKAQQEAAATTIQAAFRGFIAKKEVSAMKARRNAAAIKIQAVYRGRIARKNAQEERIKKHSAVAIQKTFRGHLSRKQTKKLRQEQEALHQQQQIRLNAAALTIQCAFRVHRAIAVSSSLRLEKDRRLKQMELERKKNQFATKIQLAFRAFRSRSVISVLRQARELAQQAELAQERVNEAVMRIEAAVTIQCAVRQARAREITHRARDERRRREEAYLEYEQGQERKTEQPSAAVVIFLEEPVNSGKLQTEEENERHKAATKIQLLARTARAKDTVSKLRQQRILDMEAELEKERAVEEQLQHSAATKIQIEFRSAKRRESERIRKQLEELERMMTLERHRELQNTAALKIQSAVRISKARETVDKLRKQRELEQEFELRREEEREMQYQTAAATRIQLEYRSAKKREAAHVARRKERIERKKAIELARHSAAVKIQLLVRYALSRKIVRMARQARSLAEEAELEAEQVQERIRAEQERELERPRSIKEEEEEEEESRRRESSALVIQRAWKCACAHRAIRRAREQRSALLEKELERDRAMHDALMLNAILILQRSFRVYLSRIALKKAKERHIALVELELENERQQQSRFNAAVKIQSFYRGSRDRQTFSAIRNKRRASARKIQTAFRRYRSRSLLATLKQQRDAQVCQEILAEQRQDQLDRAAGVIQRGFRCWRAKKTLEFVREQARLRIAAAETREQERVAARRLAAVIIQRSIRSAIARKHVRRIREARANYEQAQMAEERAKEEQLRENAAAKITATFRRAYCSRTLNKLREARRTIEAAELEQEKLNEDSLRNNAAITIQRSFRCHQAVKLAAQLREEKALKEQAELEAESERLREEQEQRRRRRQQQQQQQQQQQEEAASKIQRAARSAIANNTIIKLRKQRLAEFETEIALERKQQEQEEEHAALKIQCMIRCAIARMKLQQAREARAAQEKAHIESEQAQLEAIQNIAAVKIQKLCRSLSAQKLLENARRAREDQLAKELAAEQNQQRQQANIAAATIQRSWRCYCARNALANARKEHLALIEQELQMQDEQHSAEVDLQEEEELEEYNPVLPEQVLEQEQSIDVAVSTAMNAQLTRATEAEAEAEAEALTTTTTTTACEAQLIEAEKEKEEEAEERRAQLRNKSATTIQMAFKAYKSRATMQALRLQRELAIAEEMQRELDEERENIKDEAATKIQAHYRGYLVRRRRTVTAFKKQPQQQPQQQQQQAINKRIESIQRQDRGQQHKKNKRRQSRVHFQLEAETIPAMNKNTAATKIQCAIRVHAARQQVEQLRRIRDAERQAILAQEEEERKQNAVDECATKIQAAFRGHLARRTVSALANQRHQQLEEQLRLEAAEADEASFRVNPQQQQQQQQEEEEEDAEKEPSTTTTAIASAAFTTTTTTTNTNTNTNINTITANEAAAKIQFLARQYLSRMHVDQLRLQRELELIAMEREEEEKERDLAAKLIQQRYRLYCNDNNNNNNLHNNHQWRRPKRNHSLPPLPLQ